MRLRFLWVGKTKSAPIKSMVEDYLGRMQHFMPCEVLEARDPSRKRSLKADARIESEAGELEKHLLPSGRLVALDETGRQFSSSAFSEWFESEMNRGSRSVTFVVGGPDGLDRTISGKADLVLSMGKMTWTHEMCRALLLEQVYRAICILRGIPYHKG
ncbi:MAG: 23S rRNA (pseudouridine(1915)-N(3))-methyltransferase RlmH [Acidobacteriota bacterium]|jgi:23S rRNA (pseudouridine1915-N3)-methyltransferase